MQRLLVVGALGLAGCSDYAFHRFDGLDVYYQNPVEAVDILMVVDNSCSMGPYQEKLGRNFNLFISWFIDANVDYHIAVTTTDIEWDRAGEFVAPVITPDTNNADQVFSNAVNVGTTGSGAEMGLEAAKMALSTELLSDVNRNFLREEADLSIIFTSDEQDGSPEPVNHYINNFFTVKGQRDRDVFNASALTVTNEDACTEEQAYASSPGTRYVDVAEQTRGVTGNLCAQDFEAIVTELSLNASRLNDTFYLSDWPDAASLEVGVNEDLVPCEDGVWTYQLVLDGEEERPAIVFTEGNLPAIDSRIEVHYDFGSGEVDTFCTGDSGGEGE